MPVSGAQTRLDFLSPVSRVPGIGPKRAAALEESGLATVGDLLYHLPRRYVDRSSITPASSATLRLDTVCSVIGTVTQTRVEKGRSPRFRIRVQDDTGGIDALWFHGIPYLRAAVRNGMRVLLTGKMTRYGHGPAQMVHPQLESIGEGRSLPEVVYLPQYPLSETMRECGISQKTLLKANRWLLDNVKHFPRILPRHVEERKGFPPLAECLLQLHFPGALDGLERFRERLRYEELYTLAVTLRWNRRSFEKPGRSMEPGSLAARFERGLPFRLTDEQRKAVDTLSADAASSRRMHRLLQGDVGCGKTVVAFFACLPALNSGYQVAWLAPTEVLAFQTWLQAEAWLRPLGLSAALLKGSLSAVEKQAIHRGLANGSVRFVVGTHALLQPAVKFGRLGMVVVDEQHRFGVDQRQRMQEKDPASDMLLMSATPIPRSLAQTMYGDLDIVTIRELPKGRMPVRTHVVPSEKRADMERFVAAEISKGNKAYYVVPRIDCDDEEEDVKDIGTVFENLTHGVFRSVKSACVHGRMPAEDKEIVVRDFSRGDISLLVATTVVEVGIDTTDATVMVVENADRFGLAQLHQLRGRVGRGSKESYCFLLPSSGGAQQADQRLKAFCRHHDGFEIAEMDLSFRGPGDVGGFRQSGWDDLRFADIVRDAGVFREIQEELGRRLAM